MTKDNKVLEVEHENLILGQKLIDLYEDQIKTLKAENETLKAQLRTIPNPNPVNIRPTLRTLNQIREALEKKNIKSYGSEAHESNSPKIN